MSIYPATLYFQLVSQNAPTTHLAFHLILRIKNDLIPRQKVKPHQYFNYFCHLILKFKLVFISIYLARHYFQPVSQNIPISHLVFYITLKFKLVSIYTYPARHHFLLVSQNTTIILLFSHLILKFNFFSVSLQQHIIPCQQVKYFTKFFI